MDLYGEQSRSLPQKTAICVFELMLLYLSFRFLFGAWGHTFQRWMGWTSTADQGRRITVLVFSLIVFLRVALMMFLFLKRRIPLAETASIPLAFAVYYVGFALMVLRTGHPMGMEGAVGIALFGLGSFLNSGAELQRHRWKLDASHLGHVYRGGMFGWAVHINYLGDVLWVAGYALVTGNPWALLFPIALFGFFAFFNMPKLDQHLSEHYGNEFRDYAKRTARMIPGLY